MKKMLLFESLIADKIRCPLEKELSQTLLSTAARNWEPNFGYSEIPRSPSPTYTLPPAADTMARAMALQISLEQQCTRSSYDRRICQYIDSEALES
jgi:hypothetical protein